MVIGLTGKSCSGKNRVGDILESLGLEVWDLDKKAHEGLVANADRIRALFGPRAVRRENGRTVIDRKAIADVVFSDPSMRTKLEGVLYPWLERMVQDWVNANPKKTLVLNGALLYRSGFNRFCDHVIYVDASYETRLKRALQRDGATEEAFAKREASQDDVDFRAVDYGVPLSVVANDEACMDKLRQQVFNICEKLAIIR